MPSSASFPADRLAPTEMAPGLVSAFDLKLPRGSILTRSLGDTIYAQIPLSLENVTKFIREQADSPEILFEATKTIFPQLKVYNMDPKFFLKVEISTPNTSLAESQILVRRIEQRVLPTQVSKPEAMRNVGLTPDGKLLDPTRLD